MIEHYTKVVATFNSVVSFYRNPKNLDVGSQNKETPPAKPSIEKPPKLKLKDLPSHMKYAFLGSGEILSIIVAANLLDYQVMTLTSVLSRFIKLIGWIRADIIGIPLGIFFDKINLIKYRKLSIENQIRLNLPM